MNTIRTVDEMKNIVHEVKKEGKSMGLVPTMGYFHEGHLSLIREARKECDILIVSIFVNPTQFGPSEDYERYPRDLGRDELIAEREKVDFIFAPNVSEMYPSGYSTFLEVKGLSKVMCGKSRPAHFRGVTTVVAKLFNLVQPDVAYFGQKDAQQAAIIKKMVSDLNMGVEIRVFPIVREKDGLAMSSRNACLNEDERKAAPVLHRALLKAKDVIIRARKKTGGVTKKIHPHRSPPPSRGRIKEGDNLLKFVREEITRMIESEKLARIDYIAIADPENLQEVDNIEQDVLIAVAVWIGKTRLIDNVCSSAT